MKYFFLSFLLLLILPNAYSQEKDNGLDAVTVTTSVTAQKISETGREVLVIKGDMFGKFPIHSIDELLRYLPGVEIQQRGPMGAQSDIVIRGGTFQQVLVLIDGVRVNDPNTGHFNSYIPIAPSEIDRIEILKGAASAIYGTEAVGGVIQVITKTFSALAGKEMHHETAQITAGQFGLWNLNAGAYYSNGKTFIAGGILSDNAKGQQQRGIHGFVHANTASVSIGHIFNDHLRFSLRAAIDDRKFAAQNFYSNLLSDTANEKINSYWTQLAVDYRLHQHLISIKTGYKKLKDQYQFNPVSPSNISYSHLSQLVLTDEWKISASTIITSGAQLISKNISSNDRGNHSITQTGLFAVLNQQFGKSLSISPALRLDHNETYGWELVPQINASYHISSLILRASAGKTVRDADFTERYNNYNKTIILSGRIGNPDLAAERSLSYEAGVDYTLFHALKISVTYFERHHTNLIDYVLTPYAQMPRKINLSPTGIYLLAKNIAQVKTKGIETNIQYNKKLNEKQEIIFTAGLSWMNSRSSDTLPSFYISSHAKFLLNASARWTSRYVGLSVNTIYKTRVPQSANIPGITKVSSSYYIVNAKLEGYVLQNKLSLFIEADNLANKKYLDLLGAVMPTRWWMGGISLSF